MDDLDEAVVEASGVAHQPEHEDPVECKHAQDPEGAAVQHYREVLSLAVEGQQVRDEAGDLVVLTEVVVDVPVIVVDPLTAHPVEV